ncbi:hypothetical protein H696_05042 [Fonticula alba]|uniref:sphinganine-1-phosphate aldolase n=1 Tax=Fonticula alba TaxID=691883 RepID=A0A058Z4A7_FONAL|nr:hypothetical protein H696_05042 [Fonticula alba]KCV68758.1 hypothetical protein H696_05042 [Fonticula alba]|eukprot:XP_009497190.1 hypothetical protein H696_05042 [Fonticula alba]
MDNIPTNVSWAELAGQMVDTESPMGRLSLQAFHLLDQFLYPSGPPTETLTLTSRLLIDVKNVIVIFALFRLLSPFVLDVIRHGPVVVAGEYRDALMRTVFTMGKAIPAVRRRIDRELAGAKQQIEQQVAPVFPGINRYAALPERGLSVDEVKQALDRHAELGTVQLEKGRASGTLYWGGTDITELSVHSFERFTWSNPLHADIFPGVRKMDAEVVAMCLDMFNAGPNAGGTTTSGGTESLLLACKAHRDWARATRGVTEPEMIVPVTAHAAFDKAASYFNIKIYKVGIDGKTGKVNLAGVRRLINRNTIMLVGSAPGFPHGIVDDIEALGRMARRAGIGLHVDCCLGGFVVPFMEEAGFRLPGLFDFRVPGVTSISCDTHKYGFAPKGSSVIMYATRALRAYQYFVTPDWSGGIYASPSIAGSRPGAVLAGAWATMVYMGRAGYVAATRQMVSAARRLTQGIREIEGLYVIGEPLITVVAFASDKYDIFVVSAEMTKRGWNLNTLQFPSSIHYCCTMLTTDQVVNQFLADLGEIMTEVRRHPDAKPTGTAAIYGMAAALPDRSIISEVTTTFVDALYKA